MFPHHSHSLSPSVSPIASPCLCQTQLQVYDFSLNQILSCTIHFSLYHYLKLSSCPLNGRVLTSSRKFDWWSLYLWFQQAGKKAKFSSPLLSVHEFHANEHSLWGSVEPDILFVLSRDEEQTLMMSFGESGANVHNVFGRRILCDGDWPCTVVL